ncbi:MAG: hypothetical protein ACOYNN_04120 [Terrimicrobiaceae bacterium]
MRRGREQADLIKAVAAKHGVTPRAARKWRDSNDNRWIGFLAERAAAGSLSAEEVPAQTHAELPTYTEEELTLDWQIRKMREKVADLSRRADLAQRAGDIDSEMALRRMHMQHMEAARRLEKDAPSIQRDSGDVIPKRLAQQAIIQYSATVAAALANLPDRILTLLPAIESAISEKIRDEVNEVLKAAREIQLNAAPGV